MEYTPAAAQEIKQLLTETRRSDRQRQKRLRDRIRTFGFFISDFDRSGSGFRPEDFDQLIAQGTIRIIKDARRR